MTSRSRSVTATSLAITASLLAPAFAPAFGQADEAWKPKVEPRSVDLGQFTVPDDLEVTVWASTPMLFNPTNMDIVSQPPDLLVYTDVDRDLKFDPAVDKREVLLTGFIARSIVTPSADIAHGYDGVTVQLKDGDTVHGRALNSLKSDPLIVQSTGGITQMIPRNKIKKTGKLNRSLMLSADQLQLNAQDIADLLAFLKSCK